MVQPTIGFIRQEFDTIIFSRSIVEEARLAGETG